MELLRQTFRRFVDDRCPELAAALSFYAVFSLPPLLILLLGTAGLVVSAEELRARLTQEISLTMGREAARQVQEMIQQARPSGDNGMASMLLGSAALVFGATRAFAQLQTALNRIWGGERERRMVRGFVGKRLVSFAMILLLALLVVVSLVASAVLRAAGELIGGWIALPVPAPLLQVIPSLLSLLLFPPFFAALFVILPDAKVAWRDAWVGAAVTTILFEAGKSGIGLYLAEVDPARLFGAAGALALVLLWVYYSTVIVFVGAEFTRAWSGRRRDGPAPADRARPEPDAEVQPDPSSDGPPVGPADRGGNPGGPVSRSGYEAPRTIQRSSTR